MENHLVRKLEKSYIPLLVIMVAVSVFLLATRREGHGWRGDFAQYVAHAKNIVEGTQYSETGYIYNPNYPALGPRTYPPVFPLLLSPLYWLFGLNLEVMKMEVIFFFVFSLFMIYMTFKDELPGVYVLILVIIIGFTPAFFRIMGDVQADIPYMFFLYLTMGLINKAHDMKQADQPRPSYVVLIAASLYLCYGTRSAGLVLVPAFLIADILRFRKLSSFAVKVILLFGVFALLQNLFLHNETSYIDQLVDPLKTVPKNLSLYATDLMALWRNGFSQGQVTITLSAVFLALFIIGLGLRIARRITVLESFTVFYLVVLMVWSSQAVRFFLPLMPLYMFFALVSISSIRLTRYKVLAAPILGVLALAIVVSYASRYAVQQYGPHPDGVHTEESQELINYIKTMTKEDDVFIFRKPRALALLTGRSASINYKPQDDRELWDYFRQIKATYVVTSKDLDGEDGSLPALVKRNEPLFERVYQNKEFSVYRIRKP